MAKFLFFPYSNQLGTTIPSVTLANLLRDKGHEVIYASNGKYTHVLKDKGFEVHPINEISYTQYRRHVDNNNVDFYDEGLIHHLVDKDLELIEKVKPDVIVSNNRPSIKISAQIANKKLVTIVIPSLTRYFGHRYYVPENHFLNKILPVRDVNTIMPEAMVRFAFFKTMQQWGKNFNKVLRFYKLAPMQDFLGVYEGDVTLINQSIGLFPFKSLPENYYFLEQNLASTFGVSHSWLQELELHKQQGKKVIFVSMGSSSLKAYPLVMNALKELIEHDERFVLVSNHVGLITDGKKHSRIFLESFINSSEVLPKADIVVTHGGINTLSECLQNKKVVVGVPEQGEQLWNLKYIEDKGLGKVVSKFALEKNPSLVVNAVLHVANSNHYNEAMEHYMQGKLQKQELEAQRESLYHAIEKLL